VLEVVERGQRGDQAAKRRMDGYVLNVLAADVDRAPVAQTLDVFRSARFMLCIGGCPPSCRFSG
jgi:hypothetical protein